MAKEMFLTIKVDARLRGRVVRMAKKEKRSIADQTAYLMELGMATVKKQNVIQDTPFVLPGAGPVMEAKT